MEEDRRRKTEDRRQRKGGRKRFPSVHSPSSILSSSILSSVFRVAGHARDFLHGMAVTGYRRQLRAEAMELNDLFMLLCFMETLGLPNP
ncbi:MAG TPA: hypothetical protein VLA21_00485, partial [Candidatus Limnocylindria bacterium]|nr:hypothetical protein [Candidatus Limnocylindria bacterium]